MPTPGFFNRMGGKTRLVKDILPLIPDHTTYVEPFVGGGKVFFSKPKSQVEVLNDLDGDIYDLYNDIKHITPEDLVDIDWRADKQTFKELQSRRPVEPKERFVRNMKVSFNSFCANRKTHAIPWIDGRDFGVCISRRVLHSKDRLADVHIHNKDWKDVVKEYDSPTTFFYLDPPYSKESKAWGYAAFVKPLDVAEVCKGMQGKFVLSYDDALVVRQAFKDFDIMQVFTKYKGGKNGRHTDQAELLIKNF